MKILIFIIFLSYLSVFAKKLDIELFGNMSKIKIAINNNTKIEVSENYFKRYIDLHVENAPKNFKSQLLAYNDNIIDEIKILKESKKILEFRIFISKINFFYDYRIENNYFSMPIGLGLKIVPLKTSHNLIFVPYFFDIILQMQNIENLSLSQIYSTHEVAQGYNDIIKLYSKNNYKMAKEKLKIFMKKNVDEKSLTILKYLDAELDFRLRKENIKNCTNSIIKFKTLIEEHPDNLYNDRAVVFMYLCSKENQALSDTREMVKKVVNEYTNSPYYYRFLYEDALNDYNNGNHKDFKYKLKTIIKRSSDNELKIYALYKLYGFNLKAHYVAEAYELIKQHSVEYSKYTSYSISPYFLIAYGDSIFFSRDFAKARKIYEKVIKLTPNKSLVKYAKVRISDTYLYQYDYDKVEKYFQKNNKFFHGEDIGSQLAKIRLDEYEGSFYDDDKLTQKFNIMQQYLKNSTLREELIFREAQIYFYKEDYLVAYLKIKKLISEYPKTTLMITAKEMIDRIIYAAYFTNYKNKKYTVIYQLYSDDSEIIKLHPEYYNLAYMIINSLNNLEQYKKLTELINYILTKKLPLIYEEFFLYKLADAYLNEDKFYKAIHVLTYIKIKDKYFKNDYRNFKFLGDYYWKRKKYKKAITNYNKAIKKNEMPKKNKFKVNNKLANFFFNKRAYSPALKYYIKADKIKNDKEILLKIGEIYFYMKEYDKSIIILNRFLNKYPKNKENAHIYYKIGVSWIKNGNYDKGIFIMENYIKKHSGKKNTEPKIKPSKNSDIKTDKKSLDAKPPLSDNDFWVSQIKNVIEHEKYKYKLKKINEIKIDRRGL